MKRKFLLLALGATLTGTAWAQSTDSTNTPPANPPPPSSPPPGDHHHFDLSKILTPAERQKLAAAHAAAIKANPDLAAQEKNLMAQMKEARDSGEPPDPQLIAEGMDLRKKLNQAMLQADPSIAPILAKLEAAKKHHGPPPQPPGQQDQSSSQQQGQQSQPPPPPTNSAPSGN